MISAANHEPITKAIEFLAERQRPSGELATEISPDREMLIDCQDDGAVFTTSIVAYSLAFLGDDARAQKVREQALDFLESEQIPPGIWRYWTFASGKTIAADVDDTAFISLVLEQNGRGKKLRASNRPFLLANRNRDGLFQTWLSHGQLNDVDSVANANVLLYLGDGPETARAAAYLNDLIHRDAVAGSIWYYSCERALEYAMARALYHGNKSLLPSAPQLEARILRCRRDDGSFGNELETALAISSLMLLAEARGQEAPLGILQAASSWLVARQQEDGGWRRLAYYQGPAPPTPTAYYFGSRELTTALCLEALARCRRASPAQRPVG